MSDASFLNEQTKKELGDFLTKYMQDEPPSMTLPRVNAIRNVELGIRNGYARL